MPQLAELQPYLSGAAALVGLATLTFVLRLASHVGSLEQKRTQLEEKRTETVKAELELARREAAFEQRQLSQQNEALRSRLERILNGEGLSLDALAAGQTLADVRNELHNVVEELLSKMEVVDSLETRILDPAWHLEMGRGFMATREWAKAAHHLDEYTRLNPIDHEVQFARGVAHANSRNGRAANLSALRAYNEAVALIPGDAHPDVRARYISYRGAMLKRLGRLIEAEADLQVAIRISSSDKILSDAQYNLACVYGMLGNRAAMMLAIQRLEGNPRFLQGIRFHLEDYFNAYKNDTEFLVAIGGIT